MRKTIVTSVLVMAALLAPRDAFAGGGVEDDELLPFVASLAAGTATATDGHLAGCGVLVTPDGRVHRPCALTLADLVGTTAGVTLKVTRNKIADLPHSQYGFREAVVEARVGAKVLATFDVVEIFGIFGNPDSPNSRAPVAVMWSRQITDKAATAAARAGKLPAPPPIADFAPPPPEKDEDWDQDVGDAQNGYDWVKQSVQEATHYQRGLAGQVKGGTIVLGSAPKQKFIGKAGARAIARWKVDLTQEGGVDTSGEAWVSVAVTHLVGTTGGKTPTTIPYVVMVVNTQFLSGGGAPAPQLSLVKFAIAQ